MGDEGIEIEVPVALIGRKVRRVYKILYAQVWTPTEAEELNLSLEKESRAGWQYVEMQIATSGLTRPEVFVILEREVARDEPADVE